MTAEGALDPALGAYLAAVAGGLARVLGPALVGAYLHGSAVLGGWSGERSDVDLLGVVARPIGQRAKRELSARLNHPSLTCPSPGGLDLSLVTAAVAADPPRQPPFELQVTTGPSPRTRLGGAADPDLLLQLAVCRRSGLAVTGPDPVELLAEPPRAWLLEQAAAQLRQAAGQGSFAYRVLTGCRAWRYLEDDVLGSRVESGRWARLRLAHPEPPDLPDPPSIGGLGLSPPEPPGAAALVDAAVAGQLGQAPMPDAPADLAAADRFVAAVLGRFREAGA